MNIIVYILTSFADESDGCVSPLTLSTSAVFRNELKFLWWTFTSPW